MAARAKTLDNMDKHMTVDETRAREDAEASLRGSDAILRRKDSKGSYQCPKSLNPQARAIWREVLKRTEDVELLEDPDIHVLEIYCSMVARIASLRDQLNKLEERLDGDLEDAEWTTKDWVKALQTLDSLQGKVLTLEKTVLSYADKLGLTPSSRAHLARKRADAAIEADPDGDLFA